MLHFPSGTDAINLGVQGCKNELRGGDSLRDIDSGPYLTYVVYMSYKRPSMQVRSPGVPTLSAEIQ